MDVLRKETSICHGFETSTYLETNFCHSVRWQVYHLHPSAYWVVGGDTDTDIWSDRSGCSFLTGYWRINRICHWCLNGCQRWLTLGVPSLSSMVTPVQSSPISMKHRRHSLGLSQEGQTKSDAQQQRLRGGEVSTGGLEYVQWQQSWDFHRVAAAALLSVLHCTQLLPLWSRLQAPSRQTLTEQPG